MWVEFGNANAVEGYRDPAKATDGQDAPVEFRPIKGEQITTVHFPEDMSISEAFTTAVAAVGAHFEEGSAPAWVDSDSEGLKALLVENFKIDNNTRPEGWGASADQNGEAQ